MSASFKLILIGDTGVGKSSLVFRLCEDVFFEDHCPTLGVDFKYARRNVDGVNVNLQLWDTAGQDQFLALTSQYYRGCHGVLMCFDLTSRSTFEHLRQWQTRLTERLGADLPPTLIIGCKLDLADPLAGDARRALSPGLTLREVSMDEGQNFAQANGMSYLEVSAKDGRNVVDGFDFLVELLMSRHGVAFEAKRQNIVTPMPKKGNAPTGSQNSSKTGCRC